MACQQVCPYLDRRLCACPSTEQLCKGKVNGERGGETGKAWVKFLSPAPCGLSHRSKSSWEESFSEMHIQSFAFWAAGADTGQAPDGPGRAADNEFLVEETVYPGTELHCGREQPRRIAKIAALSLQTGAPGRSGLLLCQQYNPGPCFRWDSVRDTSTCTH